MTVRVSVVDHDTDMHFGWFRNFISQSHNAYGFPAALNKDLQPWNGRDVPNSEYLEFDSEQDVMLFILRWS